MDTQKATEVEMKELTAAEVKDEKDAEKSKVEGTKEVEKETEEKEKKEKEIKKEGNVYMALKTTTEDVYNISKESEAKKEEGKVKGDEKAEETNVYSKLNDPPENVDKLTKPTSSSKDNEEAKKKAEGKEKDIKEEETNVYSKLNAPTEDVYNISKPTSSSKRSDEEENVKEDEETDLYCKLNTPSENVYMAAVTGSRAKDKEDVYRKLYLFKRISVFFMVLTLLLLAVVFALAIKLNENKSIQTCQDLPAQDKKLSDPPMYRCTRCDKDWIKINGSCYFPSMKRLNWYDSRKACQEVGGDLVVITSKRLQELLSRTKGLMYWIGLRYAETEWMWINNTTLTKGYWAPKNPNMTLQDSCVLLHAQKPNETNWHIRPCGDITSHYMCQKG